MIKIFFIIFFLAELVIALTIIIEVYKFDRRVNKWNNLLLANRTKITLGLSDFRILLEDLSVDLLQIKEIIEKKRQEFILSFAKTSASYFAIFMLKGKYKKAFLAYQVGKEIYEGLQEA